MDKLQPLKFRPTLKQTIWGGDGIIPFKHLENRLSHVGESWEISAVPGSESIVDGGPSDGHSFRELVAEQKEALVGAENYQRFGNEFPLLIKFIDAREDLSIQVHPNDAMARRYGRPFGKNEMWYIMNSGPQARLRVGLKKKITPESYARHVADDTICDVLCTYDVQPGDCFFIPAGRIHTICAGCFLAEIQQTCDLTYRIYDYGRTDAQGHSRELHTALAAEAIDYNVLPDYRTHYVPRQNEGVPLVSTPYFNTAVYDLTEPMELDYSDLDTFVILIGLEGSSRLTAPNGFSTSLRAGDSILLPASLPGVNIQPDKKVKFLETYV